MKKSAFVLLLCGGLLALAAGNPWQKPAASTEQAKAAPLPAKDTPAKPAVPEVPTGFPNTNESLNYALKWPAGATLGEAHLRAAKADGGWQFEFSVDASVPGFKVSDRYRSRANPGLCSLELEKETAHGSRHTHEKTVFDYQQGTATRTTLVDGGGHTDINISDCAHDGLDFVFYARHELAEGHGVPKQQDVLLGASYDARMQFAGVEQVTVAGKRRQADHVYLTLRGPASDYKLEIYFERDPARTPLIVKAPLPVGALTMELVR